MDFYTRALEINKTGWRVLNCYQFTKSWRVNLQMFTDNGASTEFFSEYADAPTPLEALEAAFQSAKARYPKARPSSAPVVENRPSRDQLPPAMERRLERAMSDLFFAIKADRP